MMTAMLTGATATGMTIGKVMADGTMNDYLDKSLPVLIHPSCALREGVQCFAMTWAGSDFGS